MALRDQLQELTTKQMDRRDFLKYVGGVVLAVIGVTGLVRILLGSRAEAGHVGTTTTTSSSASSKQPGGYGSSTYGG